MFLNDIVGAMTVKEASALVAKAKKVAMEDSWHSEEKGNSWSSENTPFGSQDPFHGEQGEWSEGAEPTKTVAKTWDQLSKQERLSGVKGRTVWNEKTRKYTTVFDVPATEQVVAEADPMNLNDDDWYEIDADAKSIVGTINQRPQGAVMGRPVKLPNGNYAIKGMQAKHMGLSQGMTEGVAETLPMNDAVKVLRQYGADNFKTTSNELHFYKQGRPFSIDLVMNPDATRSVTLNSLNSATRKLKGQGVAEGEVVPLGKKHSGDLGDIHSCPKCGGDLQGGNYQGHRVKVCQPCKQVYLPPNSGIDQQGNKTNEQGVAEELSMKHQRNHTTQKYADTSNSLARRSYSMAEVPNVTKSADGHPTVKYRTDSTSKAGATRVDPTITPTSVKRKDSDKPIPSFLKKEQGVAEGSEQQLSVQQLAAISDEALDKAYGYGRSSPGNTFGWQANLKSAAYAKQLIDKGVNDIEAISNAIHTGWNVTAQAFVQNPDQFADTEKLKAAGKLEGKLQQRAQLMKQNYAQLPEDEKEKDRVVARAMLQAITGGQQGIAEGSLNEGQYEMMLRNGHVKKFVAKDDADAKRIAAGHGAKSVIKLKGGVPAGKVSEQGIAEGKSYWDKLQDERNKKVNTLISELRKSVKGIK